MLYTGSKGKNISFLRLVDDKPRVLPYPYHCGSVELEIPHPRIPYAIGLITWPNTIGGHRELKSKLMGMRMLGFMDMHVNTKDWL